MNNAPAATLPLAPANIPAWTFYSELHGCITDFGKGAEAKQSFRLARRTLLKQLHLMSTTVCNACAGHGHRARDCPTNSRLGMLGAVSFEYFKLIAWARGKTLLVDRNRQAPL